MQIDIGNRKIDTSEVVEASITQEIKLKNGELIHLENPLFITVLAICCKEIEVELVIKQEG